MMTIGRTGMLAILLNLPAAATAQPTAGRAFLAEAAGGSIGSAVGVGIGLAISGVDRCDVEDLGCTIKALGVGGVGSVLGATTGTFIAGRSVGARPSLVGGFIGSLAGAAAGAGVVHLLTEEVNVHLDKPMTLLAYSLTQGIVTALGSRIGAAIRGTR